MPKQKEAHRCKRTGKVRHGIKAPKWKEVSEYVAELIKSDHTTTDGGNVVAMRGKNQ